MTRPHSDSSSSASSSDSPRSSVPSEHRKLPSLSSLSPSSRSTHTVSAQLASAAGDVACGPAVGSPTSDAARCSTLASGADEKSRFAGGTRSGTLVPRPDDNTVASAMGSTSASTDTPAATMDAESPPIGAPAAAVPAYAARGANSYASAEFAGRYTSPRDEAVDGVPIGTIAVAALAVTTPEDAVAMAEEGVHQAELASEIFIETCNLESVISHRTTVLRAAAAAAAIDLLSLGGNVLLHFVKDWDIAELTPSWFVGAALGNYFLPLLRAIIIIYCLLSFYKVSLFPLRCSALGALGSCRNVFTTIRRIASATSMFPVPSQNNAPDATTVAPLLRGAPADAQPFAAFASTMYHESCGAPTALIPPGMQTNSTAQAASSGAAPADTHLGAAEGAVQWEDGRADAVANSANSKIPFAGWGCRSSRNKVHLATLETGHHQEPLLCCGTAAAAPAAEVDCPETLPHGTYIPGRCTVDHATAISPAPVSAGQAVGGKLSDMLMQTEAEMVVAATEQMEAGAAARANVSRERSSFAYRILLLCFLGGTLRAINFQLPAAPSFHEKGRHLLQLPFLLHFWPSCPWGEHEPHFQQHQYTTQQGGPLQPSQSTEITVSSDPQKRRPPKLLRFDPPYLRSSGNSDTSSVPGAASGAPPLAPVVAPGDSRSYRSASRADNRTAANVSAGQRSAFGVDSKDELDGECTSSYLSYSILPLDVWCCRHTSYEGFFCESCCRLRDCGGVWWLCRARSCSSCCCFWYCERRCYSCFFYFVVSAVRDADGEAPHPTRSMDETAAEPAIAFDVSAGRAFVAAAAEDLPVISSSGTSNAWTLFLFFLVLETAWGVAAPLVEAVLLVYPTAATAADVVSQWKLQRCAAEERRVLRRCLLLATARYESLQQQCEEQQQREEQQQEGGVGHSMRGHHENKRWTSVLSPPAGAVDGRRVGGAVAGVSTASLLLQKGREIAAGERQRCPFAAATEGQATPSAARQVANGQGAGGQAEAAAAPTSPPGTGPVLDEDNMEDDVDWLDLLKLLRPYFWPSGGESDKEENSTRKEILVGEKEDPHRRRKTLWESYIVLRLLALSTFFTIACSKALTLLSPLLIGAAAQAAAEAATAAAAQQHEDALAKGILAAKWVVAFAAASWGADFFKEAQALAYIKVQQAASVEISARSLRHVLALHLEWHIQKQMGHVVRVIDRGTEGCSSLMTYGILYLGPVLLECIAVCLVFLLHLKHQVLASLMFISITLYAWLTLRVTFWRRKWREKQNRSDSTFHQLVVDALTNFETVKMFNAERFEVRRYVDAVEEYQSVNTKIQASLSFLNLSQRTVVCATLVGGLLFVSQAISDGSMGLSDFVTAHMYLINVFAPLNFLGTIYHMIVRSAIDAKALCRLLLTQPGITDAPGAISLVDVLSATSSSSEDVQQQLQQEQYMSTLESRGGVSGKRDDGHNTAACQHLLGKETASLSTFGPRRRGSIRGMEGERTMHAPRIDFINICFRYKGRKYAKGSLKNLNLTILPGTTCGLVGASGSGKSTLMKILLRLLEPRRGRVLIDGVDIATVTQESLRCCMGMVPQDAVMFNASIYSNIIYANQQASFADVEAAADAAQLLPLIHSMSDGWETRIGERGLKLSGGERQRVAIARCLLRNPPIILLDEATSSLDSLSEAAIQEALLQLSNRRTVLMIAHRLSTVMHADLICVMADGMIVEQGTHTELLASGGAYADLWKAQARGKTLQL